MNRELLLCPMAAKSSGRVFSEKFTAWDYTGWTPNGTGTPPSDYVGSYGINDWVSNSKLASFSGLSTEFWWRTTNVRDAANIPIILDSNHNGGFPMASNKPPEYDGEEDPVSHYIKSHCINRHTGYVNGLFLDFSVKKVGLKQLWTFPWHRGFNTKTEWTIAYYNGSPSPRIACATWWDSEREWMKNFKEY